jgi:hypothetical protein
MKATWPTHPFLCILCRLRRSALLALPMLALGQGCTQGPPEFFLLPQYTHEECNPTPAGKLFCYKREVFVIANCPKDPKQLLNVVDAFNKHTLSNVDLTRWGRYHRMFYRESRGMPRDFRADEQDWGGKSIDDHWKNIVLTTDFWGSLDSRSASYWEDGVSKDAP